MTNIKPQTGLVFSFSPEEGRIARKPPPDKAWRSWGVCVVGKKRTLNEDNMIERTAVGLWAVADGMGGHAAGDVASQAIVDALAQVEPAPSALRFADRVQHCLQEVNAELRAMAKCNNSSEGRGIIGSTVVVLLASKNRCMWLWAGDSRLYRFRGGGLERLTRDHSLLEEFGNQGFLTPGEILEAGRCDIVTRAVGATDSLQLACGDAEVRPGDVFLLCSDGLDKELTHEDIEGVLRERSVEEAAGVLVERAEERGARDNVTVVVVKAPPRLW